MTTTPNKTFVLLQTPSTYPIPGQDISVEDRPIDLSQTPPQGSLLVQIHYASLDPYQRNRMRPNVSSYTTSFELGGPVTNRSIATIVAAAPDAKDAEGKTFQKGDLISTMDACPIAEYALLGPDIVQRTHHLSNPHNIDPKHFLGALGMPGLTAYSSLHEIGQPRAGETIFVSAASGAVGQLVGQLAKREGLRVIGSVGSDDKLAFIVDDLGFDAGFNYKKEAPADALRRLAPDGIDIYYENVGGEHLEAAIDALKTHGRVVCSGMISQYNLPADQKPYGVSNLMLVVGKRLTVRGFVVGDADFGPKYAAEHQRNVQAWLADGSLKAKVSVTQGIDGAPQAFVGMLKGDNFGKTVVEIKAL